MDKYIKELISKKDTVIIPKFGALLVTVSGKGVIMFNEHLKFNDGLLVGHVAEKEGVDKEAALNMVEEYAFKIMGDLDTGEPYSIDGLGAFYKDSAGSILFNQYKKESSESSPKDEAKKTSAKKAVKEVAPEANAEKPANAKEEKSAKAKSDEKKAKTEKKPVDKPKAKSKETKPKYEVKEPKEASKKSTSDKKEAEKKIDNSEKKETTKKEADKKKAEPKKSSEVKDSSAVLEALSEKEEIKAKETPKPQVTSEVKDAIPPISKEDVVKKATVEVKPIPEAVKSDSTKKVDTQETQATEKAAKPMDHVSPTNEKVDLPPVHIKGGKPKKKKRIGVLILILVLIGLGTFVGLKFDMVKSWFATEEVADYSKKEEKKDEKVANEEQETHDEAQDDETELNHSELEAELDSTSINESTEAEGDENETTEAETEPEVELGAEPEPTPEPEPAPVAASGSSGQYHIIASAFRSESNADNYVNTLQGMGFTSASKLGKINGLYTVAAGSYGSNSDAKSALQEVRTKTGKAAWVLKY